MQLLKIHQTILLLIALFLFACTSQNTTTPSPTAATPIHTQAQVIKSVKDYLSIYYALWGMSFGTPTYENSTWQLDVDYTVESGSSSLRVYVRDTDLKVIALYEKASVLTEPRGVTQIQGRVSCSQDNKLKVMLFSDPYCPFCIKYDADVKQLLAKFNNSIDFEYHVLQTSSLTLEQTYDPANVTLASYYFICAQEQGKLQEFKDCATSKYLEHEGIPLTKKELSNCVLTSNMDEDTANACLSKAQGTLALDYALAQTYMGNSPSTPTIVIDCKYLTNPKIAEEAICYYYNATKGCSS